MANLPTTNFWGQWCHADEMERLYLVQQLTGFKSSYSQAVLLNSYLSDLVTYLEEKSDNTPR